MKRIFDRPTAAAPIRWMGRALILLILVFSPIASRAVSAEPLTNKDGQRVVQVVLEEHAKISQYTQIDSSAQGYGKNACGLVAAAAAVGGEEWVRLVDLIADAAGVDYHKDLGIQPSKYAAALQSVFGISNVTVLNHASIDALYDELEAGNIVIVDFKVNESSQIPSVKAPNYAHFARVLGIDKAREEVYVENTLRRDAYWTISFDEFLAAWDYPETTSSLIPDPENAEDVTRWAVVLDSSLSDDDLLNEL